LQGIHFASTRRRRTYRPSGPEDDEVGEVSSHSNAKGSHQEPSISERPASLGHQAQAGSAASGGLSESQADLCAKPCPRLNGTGVAGERVTCPTSLGPSNS
jgi:hypothetical protein